MSLSKVKLSLIDRFQFLSSSLDGLVRNLYQDGFKYLIQEFDNNILDLLKKKGFYLDECMNDSEKFFKKLSCKAKFYSQLNDRKISDKEYEHILNVWKKFQMKTIKSLK